jgi:signal transduction histidine kinase
VEYYKTFLLNVSILITCAYLFNLGYKYLLQHTSDKVKQAAVVGIFIFSGWLAMVFGVRMGDTALFDLRVVPIIFATLVFRDFRTLLVIGFGIALARYTIMGITPQALTGSINIMILGCFAAFLVVLYQKKNWGYRTKALVSIITVNTLQVTGIALFGALPRDVYLQEVVVYTYPLALLLSAFFVFIIRDFYKDQLRVDELRNMNLILRRQTRESREAKRALEEKARQLMLASKYKSEFMANMSHELKTPLNSIILLSQMIRENEEEKYQGDEIRYAEIIYASGNELLQMINDILDLSKVEAGKMDVILETVALEDLMQLIHHQFLPMTEQKGLQFEVNFSPEVPETIVSDALRLSQILRNLLVNAVKFTDKGSVTLSVSVGNGIPPGVQDSIKRERGKRTRSKGWGSSRWTIATSVKQANNREAPSAADAEWLVFSVKDTGIGIEPDKQELIFEAFQQEDGAINRKYGGTGLGLSISLQLARLLGGTLTLHSVKGEGSEFALRLPVQLAGKQGQSEPETGADKRKEQDGIDVLM